ncbi:DUF1491 family protein [Chelativorans sp. AA-79]|uniref:DUF1491 family protein n=1 Tax=Chelativorans sp. AA-79 TaxID=3028735 RepID=UPI0023F6C1D3|nr:DUF1491 family protein [Chelativorans sp. AA-79]WEX07744.1 DUF1491 family protein [Chelativorans sp. AA-79]
MRLTSDFWVSALVKRIFSDGGFAAVRRRGAGGAGAVFIIRRTRLGELELYAPAPQTSYDEAKPSDRQFQLVLATTDEDEVETRLGREMRFDPDVWVVEIETAADLSGYLELISP